MTNIHQEGADTHAELVVTQESVNDQRPLQVTLLAGRTVPILLPANSQDGDRLRMKGEAMDGKGDLYICVRIQSTQPVS